MQREERLKKMSEEVDFAIAQLRYILKRAKRNRHIDPEKVQMVKRAVEVLSHNCLMFNLERQTPE